MIYKYNWDLSNLLGNKTLKELYDEWVELNDKLIQIYNNGKCYLDLIALKQYLTFKLDMVPIENKLFNYISNKLNEDLSNKEMINWNQKLSNKLSDLQLNFSNEINIILENKSLIKSFLNNDLELKKYERFFQLIFREENHKLSDKEEELLSKLSSCLSSDSIFSTLVDSEIKLLPIFDSNKKEKKLKSITEIDYILENSNDREFRKNAFGSLNKSFINFENTLALTLYQNFLTLNQIAKIYGHKDYVHQVCHDDEIDITFIDHVYKEVSKYKNMYKEFSKIENKYRKEKMNLKYLYPWDKSFNIYKTNKNIYSIEQSKKIIIEALSVFSDEYVSIIKKSFDENWISWLPFENKTSGAYTIGNTKGLEKYYVLLNFDKTFSSVYTVIHELGHVLNAYYTNKKQDIYFENEIFDAEIPSITNEIILSLFLLKKYKNNKEMKIKIYNELITNFFGTTIRQIMFSYTEREIINCINNNEPVSANEIKNIYAKSHKKFLGFTNQDVKKILKNNGENLSIIFRIEHFYDGIFYVYKYSIGMIVGILSAIKIMEKDEDFISKYYYFLSIGTSMSSLDKINLLGIDLTSSKPWEDVSKIVKKWIKEFKELIK